MRRDASLLKPLVLATVSTGRLDACLGRTTEVLTHMPGIQAPLSSPTHPRAVLTTAHEGDIIILRFLSSMCTPAPAT